MTNEQAIEIAEKVWGWESEYDRVLRETVWVIDSALRKRGLLYHKNDLVKEVNSWQGFGRTVEAMAERQWWFNKSVEGIWFYRYKGMNRIKTMGRDGGLTTESFIATTHLSALEALK